MSLFSRLFGKLVKISHPCFGEMIFLADKKNADAGYFECTTFFKPVNDFIEVVLTAERGGPEQEQVDFFRLIEEKYVELTASLAPLIQTEFNKWIPNFKIHDFQSEFDLVFIEIPACNEKTVSWQIAFTAKQFSQHTITCLFHDFECKYVHVDG